MSIRRTSGGRVEISEHPKTEKVGTETVSRSKQARKAYSEVSTSGRSLMERPVIKSEKVMPHMVPNSDVFESGKLKEALHLLQPGSSRKETAEGMKLLEDYIKAGNRLPQARTELLKVAKLILRGVIKSSAKGNQGIDAAKILYLAERLAGWTDADTEYTKSLNEFLPELRDRLGDDFEKLKYSTSPEKEKADRLKEINFANKCFRMAQRGPESLLLAPELKTGMSLDEIQFEMMHGVSYFFKVSKSAYIDKLNASIKDGTITEDQLQLHFEFIKRVLALAKSDNLPSINRQTFTQTIEKLYLTETLNALYASGNAKMSNRILSFLTDSILDITKFDASNTVYNVNLTGNIEDPNFDPNNYTNIPPYTQVSLLIKNCLEFNLKNGHDENILDICEIVKSWSTATQTVSIDALEVYEYFKLIQSLEKLIDSKPENDIHTKAKLKLIAARTELFANKKDRLAQTDKLNNQDLKAFIQGEKDSTQSDELLLKKLIWAVDEGLTEYSSFFNEFADKLIYGRKGTESKPVLAAKYFIHASTTGNLEAIGGLARAISKIQSEEMQKIILHNYEMIFEEIIKEAQDKPNLLQEETRDQLMNEAAKYADNGDLLQASIHYLILAKKGNGSYEARKRIKNLITKFSESTNQEDRIWGQRLHNLLNELVKENPITKWRALTDSITFF